MNRERRPAETLPSGSSPGEAAPSIPEMFSRAVQYHQAGRLSDAEPLYRQILAVEPRHADSLHLLGVIAHQAGSHDLAVKMIAQAIAINPEVPAYYSNLGNVLQEIGKLDDAIARHAEALRINPEFPDAHQNLAYAFLALGQMAEGWKEHEWRWRSLMKAAQRHFDVPQWDGEAAVGKALLIHAEQGYGDILQFCRYGPLAAARGLRVIMEVPAPLLRLVRGLPGVDLVLRRGDTLPAFDYHCPMMSMPFAFGTTLETIPVGIPSYLQADEAQIALWRTRLAHYRNLRVGLIWAGSPRILADRRRSIAPDQLKPLAGLEGIDFFSLQKGARASPDGLALIDFMDEMEDFADTAALIANLDLVISVDTAVAHLAAALGKPVWILNRFDACWRWLTGREDSPWYPSARLFKQLAPGEWPAVVNRVVTELRNL